MSTVNVRMRQQKGTARTLTLRTSLVIDKITKDGVTGAVRPGTLLRLFKTANADGTASDVLKDRAESNAAGQVTVSPYDYTSHYIVALRPATADSTLYTADDTYLTADAAGETDGVAKVGQFGVFP